jgi:hypothetical protein
MRMLSAACSLALLASAAPAKATIVIPADLGQLARDAQAIVRGRIVAVDGRWTGDRRTIETIVTLEVESYLKGNFGPTLTFRVPGGDLGRYRSIVVGAPGFSVAERVVLFLGASGPSVPYILGLNQGVFRVVTASDGPGSVVIPPPVLPASGRPTALVRGDGSRRPAPLADFEAGVRALAGSAR